MFWTVSDPSCPVFPCCVPPDWLNPDWLKPDWPDEFKPDWPFGVTPGGGNPLLPLEPPLPCTLVLLLPCGPGFVPAWAVKLICASPTWTRRHSPSGVIGSLYRLRKKRM